MKCDICGGRIWFWKYLLWQDDIFHCPYCDGIIPNPNYRKEVREKMIKEKFKGVRIDHGKCKTNPIDPGPYSGNIRRN